MGVGIGRVLGGVGAAGWPGACVRVAAGAPAGAGEGAASPARGRLIGAGLTAGVVVAVAGALVWAHAAPATSEVPDAAMGRLLGFMALVKAVVPAGALAGLVRRVRRPVGRGRLAAYAAGLWTCAAGPALIAQLGHVGLGAALFHAGWLTMAAAAWRDAGLVAPRAARGAPQG